MTVEAATYAKNDWSFMDDFLLDTKQIGVLAFLNGGEEGRTLYNAFVTGQVCYEVYKRLTVSQADVLRVGFALCQFKVTIWLV